MKANTGLVISDLGGGAHGHLGTVLSPKEYAKLSSTPYSKSTHPGPLQIPVSTAHHEAVRSREEHNEQIIAFCEALSIKNLLIAQIS